MANVYSYDTVASYSSSSSTPSSLRRPFRPLPPYQLDPWPLIWKKLDPRSFTVVQRVCKMWKSKCMLSNVASSILEVYLNAASRMLEEMAHLTKALSAYDIEATGDEKISEYFKETLEEIRNFLRLVRSRSSDLASNASFLLFYTSLEYRLETALYTLRTTRRVSQSLDLVEFSLRRSFLQLASTFPLEHGRWSPKHSYSSIISDKHAKSLWKSMAGANKPWISFKKASSQFSPRFTPFLRIILDFPSDHYISAFKWNAFTSSFGPFSHIERNINRFMFGPGGFCGFINRAHAERILMDSPKKSVLVRASRTHSSLMALSYRPPTGEIVHITSNRNFWTMKDFASTLESISKQKGVIPHSCNVPIDYFLEMLNISGYSLVNLSIGVLDPVPSSSSNPRLQLQVATLDSLPSTPSMSQSPTPSAYSPAQSDQWSYCYDSAVVKKPAPLQQSSRNPLQSTFPPSRSNSLSSQLTSYTSSELMKPESSTSRSLTSSHEFDLRQTLFPSESRSASSSVSQQASSSNSHGFSASTSSYEDDEPDRNEIGLSRDSTSPPPRLPASPLPSSDTSAYEDAELVTHPGRGSVVTAGAAEQTSATISSVSGVSMVSPYSSSGYEEDKPSTAGLCHSPAQQSMSSPSTVHENDAYRLPPSSRAGSTMAHAYESADS